MIQDYRRMAEELSSTLFHTSFHKSNERVNYIIQAFQQVAMEARREENEACAMTILHNQKWEIDPKIYEDIAKAIRSRMIGPEPMEEK